MFLRGVLAIGQHSATDMTDLIQAHHLPVVSLPLQAPGASAYRIGLLVYQWRGLLIARYAVAFGTSAFAHYYLR